VEISHKPCSGNSVSERWRWEFLDTIRASDLGSAARHLAIELALRAKADGSWKTSRADLAVDMGCSTKTVTRATRELVAAGFLDWEKDRWKGRQGWSTYRIKQVDNLGP